MSKNNKIIVCKSCAKEMPKSVNTCPSCGVKKKKPIYKKWYFWLTAIIILTTIVGVKYLVLGNRMEKAMISLDERIFGKEGEEVEIQTFKGVLVDFDDGCTVDMLCIAYVDENTIYVDSGLMPEPQHERGENQVWTDDIGKMVEVRAIKTGSNSYSLMGDNSLYIRIIE